MAFDPLLLGLPVELSQIPLQLKALWDDADHRTRACLLNLVVYCQDTAQFDSNTRLISEFVRNHACRAILVGDIPAASPKASAWVQAHCHLTKAGASEICSEQITLLAEGLSQTGVANLIMSNLDYDLPLNLWWQGGLPADANSPLWPRVDRLIFDSALWQNPGEDLHRLTILREHFGTRLTLADLNWTRTLGIRLAVAQSFDNPVLLNRIDHITQLEVRHSSDSRLAALFLASWFAAQFAWMVEDFLGDRIHFRTRTGGRVHCVLLTGMGASVTGVTVKTTDGTFSVEREAGSGLLAAVTKSDSGTFSAHYPSGNCDLLSLLSEEMTPGNRHRVYLKALTILQVLLP